jgi:hypothetical protein
LDFQPFSKIFGWSYSGNFVIRLLTSERLRRNEQIRSHDLAVL